MSTFEQYEAYFKQFGTIKPRENKNSLNLFSNYSLIKNAIESSFYPPIYLVFSKHTI